MIELLRQRRSIRKFTAQPVDSADIRILKEAALRSPTARNKDAWQFVFTENTELIEKLSQSKRHGASFLAGAPLAIVVTADAEKTDMWIEDSSIASIVLWLTAQSLGLGACWIQIRNRKGPEGNDSEQNVKKLLDAPDNMRVEAIIAIGHPDEKREPKPETELDYNKITTI